ncbi:ABC transporter permease [Microlunatus parietis]|uniref:ABC-2 type transport system permease protein n=1 Tax=Microlunatus parietis TaxID=682979 RepID=A0A7Y9I4F7_9ACTN|nr:ABC-2 family transporter protein [Microlunatus parietis]NYE69861.1 ABC-2 type transport system permease protein [Microlunatus parietis]
MKSRPVRRHLRVFGRVLALNIGLTFVYRGDFLLMQLGTLLTPLVSLAVWQAALAAGAQVDVTPGFLNSYFLLVAVVNMLTSSWTAWFLADMIRNGTLNKWLIRPASVHLDGFANNLGEKTIKLMLLVPLVLIMVVLVPGGLPLPATPARWLLFALAIGVAMAISYIFDIARGSLAFWFEDVQGFNMAISIMTPVLAGVVVPLALMPPEISGITLWQPFRFMVSFPMEVLLDRVPGGLVFGFAQQAGWLIVFAVVALVVWRRGLRSYSAAGA